MPQENPDDKDKELEQEMLRMMQEESGGEAAPASESESESESDAEAEMLRAMQEEADPPSGGEAADADMEAEMLRAMMEDTGASEATAHAALQQGILGGEESPSRNVSLLLDVSLSVSIELGQAEEPISTVLEWTEGSLIELTKVSGEAVDVLVNGKIYAKGEVVTIAENFGVRITELLPVFSRRR